MKTSMNTIIKSVNISKIAKIIYNEFLQYVTLIKEILISLGILTDYALIRHRREFLEIFSRVGLNEEQRSMLLIQHVGLDKLSDGASIYDLCYRNCGRLHKFLFARGFNRHPYHIVDPSPWPFLLSIAVLTTVLGAVSYFHSFSSGGKTLVFGLLFTVSIMFVWWRDIVREATYQGLHTTKVAAGIRLGVVLFIISEVMFFVSFFWAYLHSSLAPSIEIGGIWPPFGFKTLNPYSVPLLNTLILLTSGVTVTYVHTRILLVDINGASVWLVTTIVLALLFTYFQFTEYVAAPFDISDGIYASVFYLATGFHGLHVIIGTLFLLVALYRAANAHFSRRHHVGFEAAAWYWHFVDVVWLFLFILVYIWGSV